MKELQRAMLPDDENGAVLRQMLEDGDDLTQPRDIDFLLVFGEQAQAEAFAAGAAELPDLRIAAPELDDEGIWVVAATRHMPASHAAITALEQKLATLADSFGGYPDGWACPPAGDDTE